MKGGDSGVLHLIPDGAPSFIILVLCTGLMALIVAQMIFLAGRDLLNRPLSPQKNTKFSVFHYNMITMLLFLVAQFLGLLKIYYTDHNLDQIIIAILFLGNISLVTFACWAFWAKQERAGKSVITEVAGNDQTNNCGPIDEIVDED